MKWRGGREIRRPMVAGQFYPDDPAMLRAQVDALLEETPIEDLDGEILGLVAPHAGYPYSGAVAAYAYRQVKGERFDVVVVLAPSHAERFVGTSVYTGKGYETPLGVVPVNGELADRIVSAGDPIQASTAGHRTEHALEVQLPFLQRTLEDLAIVPIVMGGISVEMCRALADAVVSATEGMRVLIVASSDLYHGYSYRECLETDRRTLEAIERFDPEDLCRGMMRQYQACGGGPIAAALFASRAMGADRAQVVSRTNSNDVTGMRDGYVVGYAAVAICRSVGRKV